jgi:hypothetical protein
MIVEDGAVRTEYGIEESESRDIRNLILGDVVKGRHLAAFELQPNIP